MRIAFHNQIGSPENGACDVDVDGSFAYRVATYTHNSQQHINLRASDGGYIVRKWQAKRGMPYGWDAIQDMVDAAIRAIV